MDTSETPETSPPEVTKESHRLWNAAMLVILTIIVAELIGIALRG